MRRRFTYALTAGVLSSGAPAGLLGIRLARREDDVSLDRVRSEIAADRAAYMYVGAATAVIFALFGYVLGRHADALAELSETDSLTDLLNARGFARRLHAEVKRSKRYRQPLSLLFLDLDGLKDINDRHGHRAGSDALREAARVIREELRETDTGARWGGDEFTILAPNTGIGAATSFAERIRSRIAQHVAEWPLTVSIGIASFDNLEGPMPRDSAALMRAADDALYQAKRMGKNTVVAADTKGAAEAAPPAAPERRRLWVTSTTSVPTASVEANSRSL